MLKLSIEDLKLDFVRNVYEAITKQIQQMDLKISIILSWNGAMAVILAKQVTDMISSASYHWFTIILMLGIISSMIVSGVFAYQVLKPRRSKGRSEEAFAGLLYSDDILKLGKTAQDRILKYTQELLSIGTHEELYQQFTKSIVLISDVQNRKNSLFVRALFTSVLSFTLLLALMTTMSLVLK